MTGEMSKAEVTRENFPMHFAAADEVPGAAVEPFDQYQGPYIATRQGRVFLTTDDGATGQWWNEYTDQWSTEFFCGNGGELECLQAAAAIHDVVTG